MEAYDDQYSGDTANSAEAVKDAEKILRMTNAPRWKGVAIAVVQSYLEAGCALARVANVVTPPNE